MPQAGRWNRWSTYYLLLLLGVAGYSVYASVYYDEYRFNVVTSQSIFDLLVPLFIIATFLERAQEVFISSWRGLRTKELEKSIVHAKDQAARSAKGTFISSSDTSLSQVECLTQKLVRYKSETMRIAFLTGLAAGTLISIVGVRVLAPLVSWDAEINGVQGALFDLMDILLTGGLLGGGAEGIHRVVSVITDFLEETRANTRGSK